MGELLFEYSDDIHDANDTAPTGGWDYHVPARKLWVNPGLPHTTETLTDPATYPASGPLTLTCPACGGEGGLHSPLTYSDMKMAAGVVTCSCDEPLVCHQSPPADWSHPGRGRGGGSP